MGATRQAEDSIIIGSRYGMAFTLELTMSNCVPWVEPRGVRAMKLRDGDELIGMDILPSSILASPPILGKQRLRDWREAKLHRQSPSTNLMHS